MKKLLLRAFNLVLAVLFPGLLFAQQKPDYTVLLNSGNFTPRENAKTVNQDPEIFRNSAFGGKHYLTIQFKTLPDQQQKAELEAAGIKLLDYLPNLAYTATVSGNFNPARFHKFNIRSVFQLSPEQKTVPALLKGEFPAHAVIVPGFVDVNVITYESLGGGEIGKELGKVKAIVLEEMPMFRTLTIRVPQLQVKQLVSLPFVQWVEPIDAPNALENLPGRSLHRVNELQDGVRNLKGDGINVGIWDGGEVSPHTDFRPLATRLTLMENSSPSSHATHVAGTIGGGGIINPKAKGMAPNATLYSYNFSGSITTEMFNAIPALNLNISSHSYGSTQTCGVAGAGVAYSSTSRNTDVNLNTYPSHLHVHSAGNSQSACSGGWSTITGSGKTAKNNILVANITSTEAISSSSSFGPVHDGRVKPELSAMGTSVLSTYTPLNSYSTISGTSMSTPGVSGSLALVVQRYKQLNANSDPVSSLIKAAACNTAHDLGNPGPDYKFGFGRLNALAAVKTLEENRYVVNTIATGAANDHTITVPSGAVKLKVMLTWNDPAATSNSSIALVNNLDLKVINGATTTLPWVLNKFSPGSVATRAVDNVSNIEQVTLDNPAAGTYTLRVNGTAVPSGAAQQYSLTWEVIQPHIEVVYPNGGESFSPGTQEVITWNNAGVTSSQTIQYSVNNGATWSTISSSVPAGNTRYTWTVPSGLNTSTALIKVTSGPLSDVSDATFKILGTPLSLSASPGICGGTLNFTWSAVANATHYDLYSLDASGNWTIVGANITGTTYTASFPASTNLWFTIRAKNNLNGAVSERALAINRTISSSGTLSLGSISGTSEICGSQTATYVIAPATGVNNYTWSVPPGATIISGQGTTSITVDFPVTSTSGAVSVYGISGTCQTTTASLGVNVSNAIPAPVSGGDQTICANGTSASLTASATAPSGHSVMWYSTATGTAMVTSPSLSIPGTVTYYAASRINNGNCESTTRTPVTLTILPTPSAAISASGPTTFCEGDNVTLTANLGTAYLWSNGATTQAITASASGNYSVTVTQATGCSETSSATAVTVTPAPEVTIQAAPYSNLLPTLSTTLSATVAQSAANLSYTWSKDGKVIQGATTPTLPVSIDELGNYTVTATTANGCAATSKVFTIADSASATVFVYPNPNKGQFQIRFNNEAGKTATYHILVYDSKGARITNQHTTISNGYGKMEVDLRNRQGIYMVLLSDATGKRIGFSRVVVH